MDELKVLENHLCGKWFYWHRKGRKRPILSRFYEIRYSASIVGYDTNSKKWSTYNISDISQLREFKEIKNAEELQEIEKKITMLKLKKTGRSKWIESIIDRHL